MNGAWRTKYGNEQTVWELLNDDTRYGIHNFVDEELAMHLPSRESLVDVVRISTGYGPDVGLVNGRKSCGRGMDKAYHA